MKFHILTLGMLCVASSLYGRTVDCTPGALSSLASPGQDPELVITGAVNAADLFYIAEKMPEVRTLDLSGCTIAEYRGARLLNHDYYAEATIPEGVFAASKITSVTLPSQSGLCIGDFAFSSSSLSAIDIPANVKSIGMGAFAACPALENVSIGGSKMGSYVFRNCPKLVNVNVTAPVKLSEGDFAGCAALSRVEGSTNIAYVADKAFQGCSALRSFQFGSKLVRVGHYAFESAGLVDVSMAEASRLDSIGDWAFAHNPELVTAHMPAATRTLGRGAFFACTSLENLELPTACTAVADYLLKDAGNIDTINIAEGLVSIGKYAFKGANAHSVKLPSTLEHIGDNAMEGMTALMDINAEALESVPTLGQDVWKDTNQRNVNLRTKYNMVDAFRNTPQWHLFTINGMDVDGVDSPVATAPTLRAIIAGEAIIVEAAGTDIERIELFSLGGEALVNAAVNAATATVDISGFNTKVFIVRCTLPQGKTASIKLAR